MTDIHTHDGIRTHDPSKRAATAIGALLQYQVELLPLSQPAHAKSFYSVTSADIAIPVT
jgi:hypothetical protein